MALTLKRNPNFELRDEFKQPFVDGVELPFISEMAQRLAQYRAGGVFESPSSSQIDSTEVLQLKKDFPGHLLRTVYLSYGDVHMFGHNETSPFKDVRVRQAFSMAQDRDLLIQALLTTDVLEDAGIPADMKWNSSLPCNEEGWPNGTYRGWWLDPQDPEFGENAKYYQYNPDEAKAQLEAAGFPDGFEFTHMHGSTVPRSVEIINGMISEVGLIAKNRPLSSAEQTSIITNAEPQGNWGDLFTSIDPTAPDPGIYLYQLYHKSGGTFQGYNPEGRALDTEGDPFVNDLIDRINTEFDEATRMDMVFEFTRYHAKMNYRPRMAGGANTIAASWPALQNQGVWLGDSFKREWTHEWLDQMRAPFT